jgi:hypothetical protein
LLFRFVKYKNLYKGYDGKPFGPGYTLYLLRRMPLLSLLRKGNGYAFFNVLGHSDLSLFVSFSSSLETLIAYGSNGIFLFNQ